MIELCKTLTINIFWVLAAILEVIMLVLLILGILSSFLNLLKDGENEKRN